MNSKPIGWLAYDIMEDYLSDRYQIILNQSIADNDFRPIHQLIGNIAHSPRKIDLLREVVNYHFPQYKKLIDQIVILQ